MSEHAFSAVADHRLQLASLGVRPSSSSFLNQYSSWSRSAWSYSGGACWREDCSPLWTISHCWSRWRASQPLQIRSDFPRYSLGSSWGSLRMLAWPDLWSRSSLRTNSWLGPSLFWPMQYSHEPLPHSSSSWAGSPPSWAKCTSIIRVGQLEGYPLLASLP